jgi:hypothetical protein
MGRVSCRRRQCSISPNILKSKRLMYALGGHHDLGMATEAIPRGTVSLVRDGIATGKFKKMMPWVITASAFSPVAPRKEVELAAGATFRSFS